MNYIAVPGFKRELFNRSEKTGLFERKSEYIIEVIAEHFHKTVDETKLKSRKMDLVMIRRFMFYFLRKYTKLSLKQIGEKFGGRDHTTVVHGIQALEISMECYPEIVAELAIIENKINS